MRFGKRGERQGWISRLADVEWTNRESVIAYAKEKGPGHTVYKVPARSAYNICRLVDERRQGVHESWVVWRT